MNWALGIVSVVDDARALARCTLPDKDRVETFWLQVIQPGTQRDKAYWLPDVGEQVVCLLDDSAENGIILGAIYSATDVAPVSTRNKKHIRFDDGTTIEYDRAASLLSISVQGAITITATGNISITGANIYLND